MPDSPASPSAPIAGHRFTESSFGRVCISCGTRWIDMIAERKCCVGVTSDWEDRQIADEKERIWRALETVVGNSRQA